MALDEKIFQNAIAKINRIKSRQPAASQVLVFEDPPHLRNQLTPKSNAPEFTASLEPVLPAENLETQLDLSPAIAVTTHAITEDNSELNRVHKSSTKSSTQIEYSEKSELNVVHKSSTKKGTKSCTQIGYTTAQKSDPKLDLDLDFLYQRSYDSLSGIPKTIVDTIFDICRKCSSLETPPIPLNTLVRLCNAKKNSVKVARQRLLDEKIIFTAYPQDVPAKGRSGMLIYRLREDLFAEIDQNLSRLISQANNPDKKGTKYSTKTGSGSSSSSSNIYNTTTTELPENWAQIDCSPLKAISFGRNELFNIFRNCQERLRPEQIQDSIQQFAFGLEHNPQRYKKMAAPAAVLVSQLSRGIPWVEEAYQPPQQERDQKLALMLEQKFKEPKFLAWFELLDEHAREKLVPENLKSSPAYKISKAVYQREQAKIYFEKLVWPEILRELIKT